MKLLQSVLSLGTVLGAVLEQTPVVYFDGGFDKFDFDLILAQSSAPFAQELLSVVEMSGGEKTVEEEEEILLSQRGWFDSAVTREENRKKKVKQVLKMVFFLQADSTVATLDKYLYYGCYCFPDGHTKLFSGYGEPIDEVDKVCKSFQTCYRCVGLDYGQEECINSRGYAFQGLEDDLVGKKELECKDNGRGDASKCSRAQCECDKELAIRLAEMEIAWNPNYQGSKYGMFDRQQSCKGALERSAIENEAIEPRCCGFYPERTPYAYNGPNGYRNCCGSKTYDPNVLECCPGDTLQSLGTCIY